ncbi:hypothetical protein KR059_000488 [Drosophila kikkawai]|nr:hypothetical protein KR059_000488 [Drosophila kikkawai]
MFAVSSRYFQILSRHLLRRGFCQSAEAANDSGGRILAAIDFDKTIVQQDSYLAVSQLLPSAQRSRELQELIPQCGWLTFISRVLQELHSEHKIGSSAVGKCVRHMEAVPGMLRVVRRLATNPAVDLCIVSDANSFFIGEWLKEYAIEDLVASVYTNPASIEANGELLILPYEEQTECDLCPANLCKGSVMRELIRSGRYDRVVYVGDSCNDLCAMQQLRAEDVACIRRGYELHNELGTAAGGQAGLSCSVLTWRDGHELEERLMENELGARPGY